MERRHLEALAQLGTADTWHYGASLLDHLQGTYRILRGWGSRDALCLAGLFHSIYGTTLFQVRTVDRSRRAEIRGLIGAEAEELVHLFSVTDRTRYFGRRPEEGAVTLQDLVTGEALPVSPGALRDLIEIHVANDIEVFPHVLGKLESSRIRSVLELYERNGVWLSPAALAAVRELSTRL